jgi:CRISPR-associated protein Cas5t
LRLTKTSSASLIRAQGKGARQLQLTPGHVHFGGLAPGAVAHRTVRLRNVSAEVARFHVRRPPPPFRVLYKPAPVAPGE